MSGVTIGDKTISNVVSNNGKYYYDINKNGYDKDDLELHLTEEELKMLAQGVSAPGAYTLEQLIEHASDFLVGSPEEIIAKLRQLKDILDKLQKQLNGLESQLAKAESQGKAKKEEKEAIANLKKQIQALKGIQEAIKVEANQILERAKTMPMSDNQETTLKQLGKEFGIENFQRNVRSAGQPDGAGQGQAKFALTGGGDGAKTAFMSSAGYASGAGGMGGGFSFGWSAGGAPKAGFDMSAYLASTYNDQAILNGWDSVNRSRGEQQKMLMLFFYFARMAMSGDMGAMYRFMQFITFLISKDKALMNIHMASKLIELENLNREALKKLLATNPGSSSDLDAQGEFTKQLQMTQATQSSTATSQKLIAQMMEEMAQVVETLTGATKNALEANGRILQKLVRG